MNIGLCIYSPSVLLGIGMVVQSYLLFRALTSVYEASDQQDRNIEKLAGYLETIRVRFLALEKRVAETHVSETHVPKKGK